MTPTTRVQLLVSVDVDVALWAAEYGLDVVDVQRDAEQLLADELVDHLGSWPVSAVRVDARVAPDLVADLVEMDRVGAIELDRWPAALALVNGARR